MVGLFQRALWRHDAKMPQNTAGTCAAAIGSTTVSVPGLGAGTPGSDSGNNRKSVRKGGSKMGEMTVGLLHPGAMGASVGAALNAAGTGAMED